MDAQGLAETPVSKFLNSCPTEGTNGTQGVALSVQVQGLKDNSKQLKMAHIAREKNMSLGGAQERPFLLRRLVWGGSTKGGGILLRRTVWPNKCEDHRSGCRVQV